LSVHLAQVLQQKKGTKPASSQIQNEGPSHANKELGKKIIALEKQGWMATKKKDLTALNRLFAEEYVEVGSLGGRGKAETLRHIQDELTLTEYSMDDFRVIPVSPDVVLLTYKVEEMGSVNGRELPGQPAYASSLWVNRRGQWKNILYQATPGKRESTAQ
jgi:hypothetical protein